MRTRTPVSESPDTTYSLNVQTDSTQYPDWLMLCNELTHSARILAGAILIHQKNGRQPKQVQLAADLGVDIRSISRWIAELKQAKILTTPRCKRRNVYRFRKPRNARIHDQPIADRLIVDQSDVDQLIVDQPVYHPDGHNMAPGSRKGQRKPPGDTQALHGGGGAHDLSTDRDPPTPPPARSARRITPQDITTDTGRWMVKEAFSLAKAFQFQHLPLRACQLDYERRRGLGQGHGAIAQAWEVEPPSSSPIDLADTSSSTNDAPYVPAPAGRTLEEASQLWEQRHSRTGKGGQHGSPQRR